jgi:hypothetical protein
MSRTDVHAPWWVKERDPGWRGHFAEDHDHSTGPCDLARRVAAGRNWVRTRCSIVLVNRRRNIGCGCPLCTGQAGRKRGRRQERTALRAAARAAVKASRADQNEVDIAPARRITAW